MSIQSKKIENNLDPNINCDKCGKNIESSYPVNSGSLPVPSN